MTLCSLGARLFGLLVVAPGLLIASPAQAAERDQLADEFRTPAQPLQMVVHVAQDEIRAGGDPGEIDLPLYSGVVGELVDSGLRSLFRGGAERALDPSRDVLVGEEADAILMSAIRRNIASVPWVSLVEGVPIRDNSVGAKNALLDRANGTHLLFVDCSYNISQRFQAVYAYCSLRVAAKAASARKPEDRLRSGRLVYSHWVEAEVALANPADGVTSRREQWTANSGALLRTGLQHALEKVGMLVGRQLQMTQADIEAARTSPKMRLVTAYVGTTADHDGRIIDGYDNILRKVSPNPGGSLLLYKPGAEGCVFLERPGNLYYHFSIDGPVG